MLCLLKTDSLILDILDICRKLLLFCHYLQVLKQLAPTSCIYISFSVIYRNKSRDGDYALPWQIGNRQLWKDVTWSYLKYKVILLLALSFGPSSSCINLSPTQQESGRCHCTSCHLPAFVAWLRYLVVCCLHPLSDSFVIVNSSAWKWCNRQAHCFRDLAGTTLIMSVKTTP